MFVEPTTLILGAGMLFFDRFKDGTTVGEGEVFLGNVTDFVVTRKVDSISKIESIGGVRRVVKDHVVSESETIKFTTDNLDSHNLSLWFSGKSDNGDQSAAPPITETFEVLKGRFYQLGRSHQPFGSRNIDYLHFINGTTEIANLEANFFIDKVLGRFQILPTAPDVHDGDTLSVEFEVRITERQVTRSTGKTVEGSLRFIAINSYGRNKNYFAPRVAIKPSSDLPMLNTTQWQDLSFDISVIKMNSITELSYLEESGVAGATSDEAAIVDDGTGLDNFTVIEDDLNTFVNITIPSAGY